MRDRDKLTRSFTVFLALGLSPAAAFGQAVPLDVLREWMRNTEEAAAYVDKGNYARAEERLNLAIKEIRPFLRDTQRITARSYCELAKVLYLQKRYAEAEPLARWALSVRESDQKAQPDSVFQCVYTLALIQSAQKKFDEAEQLLNRSLAIQEKHLGHAHINSVLLLTQLATVYIEQAKFTDAESAYLQSIAIHERKTPDENLDLADTADRYANLLRRMKRDTEADKWHARSLAIRDTVATKAAKARADQVARQFKGFK
jgi:tetratricopeptide (TPR) repeat protein